MAEDKDSMKAIAKLPGNSACADCGTKDPAWTSINLGVFICVECAGFHRNLGVHHSKVRSVDLDVTVWDDAQLQFMRKHGNQTSKEQYEHSAPGFFVRPTEVPDNTLARENWIRAKYVRKEFEFRKNSDGEELNDVSIFMMPEPPLCGFMNKVNPRGKVQKRFFTLHRNNFSWAENSSSTSVKGGIQATDIIKVFLDEAIDRDAKYALNVETKDKTYRLVCEAKEDMFRWIHALRRAKLFYTSVTQPPPESKADLEGVSFGSLRECKLQGVLQTPGGAFGSWKSRSFVIDDGRLLWFKKDPTAADTSDGGVDLACADVSKSDSRTKKDNVFCVIAGQQTVFIAANSAQEMKQWSEALTEVAESLITRQRVDFRQLPAQ